MTETRFEKESKDNPFVSVSFRPFLFYSLFPRLGEEFRFAGEFQGDVLSARAGVFNIQDIREEGSMMATLSARKTRFERSTKRSG